jgi:hypothetical protein
MPMRQRPKVQKVLRIQVGRSSALFLCRAHQQASAFQGLKLSFFLRVRDKPFENTGTGLVRNSN